MSSKLFILTKIIMKNGSGLGIKIGKGKYAKYFGLAIIAVAFIPIAVYLGYIISDAYDLFSEIGQEGIILSLGVSVSTMIIFFFGIFFVISTYYFAGDVENLLPMPLKPYEIIGAKFIVTVIYEYLTELLFLGPIILIFGIKSGAGPVYYVYSLAVFLLLPVIPIVLSSLIVMVVMALTSIGINRDRLNLVGGVIALTFAVGLNFCIQRYPMESFEPEELISMFRQGGNSLVKITSGIFPGSSHAAMALAGSSELKGLVSILIFCAIVTVGAGLFLYAGEHLYFKGVIGISESKSKRKRISSYEFERVTKRSSSIKTYIMKEIRILLRTPVYFLNCIIINFIWPVFFLIPFLAQTGGKEGLNYFTGLVENSSESLLFAIGVAIIVFIASGNGIASSSISREGRNVFVAKYLPISYLNQILAKVFTSVLISLSGTVVIIVVFVVVLNLPLILMLMIFITGILGILMVSFTGILIDLINPKLHWESEQKAVKQNINIVFGMLTGIGFAGLLVLIMHMLKPVLIVSFLVLAGILGIACYGLFALIKTKGVELFKKLEA